MQNIITLACAFLEIAYAYCEINKNAVVQINPSLNSPFVLNIEDFTFDSNLIFTSSETSSTYYYSQMSTPQPIELNGIIISSTQQMFGPSKFDGNIALLVQNQSGYYPYLITTNQSSYAIELVGNSITNNVVCYQIMFQSKTQLLVSCLYKEQNQIIIYEYDFINQQFLQPIPQSSKISLQNITNNFMSYTLLYNQSVESNNFAFTSSIINQTQIIQNYPSQVLVENYDGYLTDIIGQSCLLFIDQMRCMDAEFKYPPSIFLKMTLLYYNRQQMLISTQDSILILNIANYQAHLIHRIPYIDGFVLNQTSIVQLFADDQYIIVSNSYTILIYQQSNTRLFWVQVLDQQSAIQYDSINKIITIITSSSIQAFQLFKPQIYMYFNQLTIGKLNIYFQGLSGYCTYQLEYKVLQNSDPGPYANYINQNQELIFQESQIQCVSCLFIGRNLTYKLEPTNISLQYHQFEESNFFNNIEIQFYYLFSNPLSPQQYALFYQLENSSNVYVIYCRLPYCLYGSIYETLNQTALFTVNGQINSFDLQFQYFDLGYWFQLYYNIKNQPNTLYVCQFKWQTFELQYSYQINSTNTLPPNTNVFIKCILFYNWFLFSNPYSLKLNYFYQDRTDPVEIQTNYQFVPRQIYYEGLLFDNLVFIDNIYELTIYELILNGTFLNHITSILYPIQQGNTSVGIGLLDGAIIITQIDDQGNQFILLYNPNVIRQINLIQQQLPQMVQIPAGAKIQFPVISSYTISKFYLAWQYNENNEIAVVQPYNTINNMILSSIYIDGQINQIQAISQGIQDILVCQYNQNSIKQISVYHQSYVKLSSNLLLLNETFESLIIYNAFYNQEQAQVINSYMFKNQIFKITSFQNSTQLSLANTLWFRFFIPDYSVGFVNTYKNSNNQVDPIGPFIMTNNFIYANPTPQLFLSISSITNGFNLYFQNNSGVYEISNFESGQVKLKTKFAYNLNCPILYQNVNEEITSICQYSPSQLIVYSNTVQNFTLDQPLNLVNGAYLLGFLILNYGNVVQIIQNNQVAFQYTNNEINITNVAIVGSYPLLLILQFQIDTFIIFYIECGQAFDQLVCSNIFNQSQIWIDSNQFGTVVNFDVQNDLLVVTTSKMSIIYQMEFFTIYGRYLISYSSEMVGIQTKIIDNYIVAIYNTTTEDQLNYTIIVYSLSQDNKVDFPILTSHSQFNGSPQQFYICQDGTIVYTYSYENQTGFSYIQVIPYVYVAIDYNNLTLISQNDTYSINNYITEVTVGNQFNQFNITFNITYSNYLGSIFQTQVWSQKRLILTIISAMSILVFGSFVVFKIYTRNKME